MPHFTARSTLDAPVAEVFSWHTRPGAFERLQPPWEPSEVVERTGEGIRPGTTLTVRTKVAGTTQTLRAEHTRLEEPTLFEDVQRKGPFARWVHQHRFKTLDAGHTELEDHVDYALPLGGLGRLAASGMAQTRLSRMFRHRHHLLAADLARHRRAGLSPRTFLIAGASGLIGTSLTAFLTTGGHTVRRLVRRRAHGSDEVSWDPSSRTLDPAALEGVDVVVNLAGAGVADARWTGERKALIRSSRVDTTSTLARALADAPEGPNGQRVFLSPSATGYFGHDAGATPFVETSAAGSDFLASVCVDWEQAAAPARDAGVRVIHPRLGPVISARGGLLGKLVPLFRAGLGGRLGNGLQWMPFVAMEDVLGAFLFLVAEPQASGAFNLVAPEPVTNAAFTEILAHVLHRPKLAAVPRLAVKGVFGEMGEVAVLGGQRVVPAALQTSGFQWLLPTLEQSLRFELGREAAGKVEILHG